MQTQTEHLSTTAAHAFLAALPEKIQRALITGQCEVLVTIDDEE